MSELIGSEKLVSSFEVRRKNVLKLAEDLVGKKNPQNPSFIGESLANLRVNATREDLSPFEISSLEDYLLLVAGAMHGFAEGKIPHWIGEIEGRPLAFLTRNPNYQEDEEDKWLFG